MIRKGIAKWIGYPLQDFYSGTEISKTQKFLEKSQHWNPEKMKIYREGKLQSLISHAYSHVPYYRELFDGLNLKPEDIRSFDDLDKIPILTKEAARDNQKKLFSENIDLRKVKKGKTGGTTGVPLEFYKDRADRSFAWGSYYRWYNWMGVDKGDKVVTVWGASTHIKKSLQNIKNNAVAWLQNSERINSYNLSERNLGDIYSEILKKDPVLIKGYLSTILFIANHIKANDLKPNKNLKAISTTTETLLPVYRNLLEDVFRVPVYDQYGCGEVSAISYECSAHRGLHINEEHVHVEIVDEKNNSISEKTGRIIVTSLNNFAMPFIRYENGDTGSLLSKGCTCGVQSQLMGSVEGRVSDTIKLKNGNEVHGVYFTDIFFELGITTDLMNRFQIVQRKSGSIDILLEGKKGLNQNHLDKIKKEVSNHVTINSISVEDRLENDESGKFRYIKREYE